MARIRRLGFGSYAELLAGRSGERGWRLRWIDSAEGLYTALGTVREPIARLWFWGHAQSNLWLYLDHAQDGTPLRPPDDAVVTVASIAAHSGLLPAFLEGGTHCFVGCRTAPFAGEWARVFGVVAHGTSGKTDFESIDRTGGAPALAPGTTWLPFRPSVRRPAQSAR
ncbi:hypothetical protein ABT124_43785 [Streptomyces sp. NPDC001982]|uniref:hypothetical protein n=1 Tax=Streptomyces sp. NPDC001982 TaxID=3154405 RepID=UPI00331CE139